MEAVEVGLKHDREGFVKGDDSLLGHGAEGVVKRVKFLGRDAVVKERFSKDYRHPTLDRLLTSRRLAQEVKTMARCRKLGIACPALYYVDMDSARIYMEYLDSAKTLKDCLSEPLSSLQPICAKVGALVGNLHAGDIVHGDLTTSNLMMRDDGSLAIIDFGLSYLSSAEEDKAVDLYVLERAISNVHCEVAEKVNELILESYRQRFGSAKHVLRRLQEVRSRGRKRLMVG
uniref:non-specific serine/threonine protein kinase n=1 Tax=Rhodosorus marinus TaxID=101924 RepID=A0A7S2ZEE5_9RHOD|mmetsp:Transcript_15837/g.64744  ORF Transcript_15837/g.64744 Transcript_15837/m.64744 type:complete len:230 (+) Transcript_15837:388-1077(+)